MDSASLPTTPSSTTVESALLKPGRNCWRVAEARRAAVLVDSAAYFRQLEESFRRATRSILIVGWDFDGRMALRPGEQSVGELLRKLVEERPQLEVRILVWSSSIFYGPSALVPALLRPPWQRHPRIILRLDRKHPLYASHHQKIVAVDDTVAFTGGIDLTVERWDTTSHRPIDRRRRDPDGTAHLPVHDVQIAVEGPAARDLAEIAWQRWHTATGECRPSMPADTDAWPPNLKPDFCNTEVAVARTIPEWKQQNSVREIAELIKTSLMAAEHTIYIEAQYFCGHAVGDLLARRLADPDGPEVVALVTRPTHGLIERLVLGGNRDRLIRRLRRADTFNRLRVYYPIIAGPEGDTEILVHSKVMVIDNRLLRIGSANLNNRSMGVDTECDVAIEAHRNDTASKIAMVRHQLLAEHLDCSIEAVKDAEAAAGSLIGAIERLNQHERRLQEFDALRDGDGPAQPLLGSWLFDPAEPPALGRRLARLAPSLR